jgi:serine protease Do
MPFAASAQAAPAPPPAPLTPQIPKPSPAPRVAPTPPPPPPAPAAPFIARLVQAPGLLFAPQASQSYLGVHLIEVSGERARELGMKEPYGVEIMSVASGSPAGDAGLRKGDVIIRYQGQRVEGQEQLVRLVRESPVGRQVELGVFRNGSEVNLNVEVGELKVPAPRVLFNCGAEPCEIRIPNIRFRQFDFDIPKPRMVMQSRLLGVELEPLEGQLAEHFGVKEGVLVRSVEQDSPASRAGLKAGDAIVEVAGRPVRDSGHIREAIRSADPEKNIALAVVRNRSRVALQMEPQAGESNSPDRQGRRVSRGDRP